MPIKKLNSFYKEVSDMSERLQLALFQSTFYRTVVALASSGLMK